MARQHDINYEAAINRGKLLSIVAHPSFGYVIGYFIGISLFSILPIFGITIPIAGIIIYIIYSCAGLLGVIFSILRVYVNKRIKKQKKERRKQEKDELIEDELVEKEEIKENTLFQLFKEEDRTKHKTLGEYLAEKEDQKTQIQYTLPIEENQQENKINNYFNIWDYLLFKLKSNTSISHACLIFFIASIAILSIHFVGAGILGLPLIHYLLYHSNIVLGVTSLVACLSCIIARVILTIQDKNIEDDMDSVEGSNVSIISKNDNNVIESLIVHKYNGKVHKIIGVIMQPSLWGSLTYLLCTLLITVPVAPYLMISAVAVVTLVTVLIRYIIDKKRINCKDKVVDSIISHLSYMPSTFIAIGLLFVSVPSILLFYLVGGVVAGFLISHAIHIVAITMLITVGVFVIARFIQQLRLYKKQRMKNNNNKESDYKSNIYIKNWLSEIPLNSNEFVDENDIQQSVDNVSFRDLIKSEKMDLGTLMDIENKINNGKYSNTRIIEFISSIEKYNIRLNYLNINNPLSIDEILFFVRDMLKDLINGDTVFKNLTDAQDNEVICNPLYRDIIKNLYNVIDQYCMFIAQDESENYNNELMDILSTGNNVRYIYSMIDICISLYEIDKKDRIGIKINPLIISELEMNIKEIDTLNSMLKQFKVEFHGNLISNACSLICSLSKFLVRPADRLYSMEWERQSCNYTYLKKSSNIESQSLKR